MQLIKPMQNYISIHLSQYTYVVSDNANDCEWSIIVDIQSVRVENRGLRKTNAQFEFRTQLVRQTRKSWRIRRRRRSEHEIIAFAHDRALRAAFLPSSCEQSTWLRTLMPIVITRARWISDAIGRPFDCDHHLEFVALHPTDKTGHCVFFLTSAWGALTTGWLLRGRLAWSASEPVPVIADVPLKWYGLDLMLIHWSLLREILSCRTAKVFLTMTDHLFIADEALKFCSNKLSWIEEIIHELGQGLRR